MPEPGAHRLTIKGWLAVRTSLYGEMESVWNDLVEFVRQ